MTKLQSVKYVYVGKKLMTVKKQLWSYRNKWNCMINYMALVETYCVKAGEELCFYANISMHNSVYDTL